MQTPMVLVEGKVAFITGGSSGIGLGIARAFAEAGMKIVIGYRNEAHLADALQGLRFATDRVHAVRVDVTDRDGMALAAQEAIAKFGKVHVLVNNAGVFLPAPLSKTTPEDWDWEIGINLTGAYNGIHAFLPHLRAHTEGGHIVTTSSIFGLFGGAGVAAYSASKFALIGMMEALRGELAGANIGVSVFCPGTVHTRVADWRRSRPDGSRANTGGVDIDASVWSDPENTMDCLEAGQYVLQGMRANQLYILSHMEYGPLIRQRHRAIEASLPDAEPTGQGRLQILRSDLTTSIYADALGNKV